MASLSEIKVFLASSGELSEERMVFGAMLNELDNEFEEQLGVRIRLNVWEDFRNSYRGRRTQDEYNDELVRTADVFIVLIRKTLGKWTQEEVEMSTEYGIKHRLGLFFGDAETPEPPSEWRSLLSSNHIDLHQLNKSRDYQGELKRLFAEVVRGRHLDLKMKTLTGRRLYAAVSDDLPCGGDRIRNIVRKVDALAEKMVKPRLYLYSYHSTENIDNCDYFFGFVGSEADNITSSEISRAIEKSCDEWEPRVYQKNYGSFSNTPLGYDLGITREYLMPHLDDKFIAFESDLKDIAYSQQINPHIFRNIEVEGGKAFIGGLEIEDYESLLKDVPVLEDLRRQLLHDSPNMTRDEVTFNRGLIKSRAKAIAGIKVQLKYLIELELRYLERKGFAAKVVEILSAEDVHEWSRHAQMIIEDLNWQLIANTNNTDSYRLHLLRLISLMHIWNGNPIPQREAQLFLDNSCAEFADAQILLLSAYWGDYALADGELLTFHALALLFSKSSKEVNRCYLIQSVLNAIENYIGEYEYDSKVEYWLEKLDGEFAGISNNSAMVSLLRGRFLTIRIRRQPLVSECDYIGEPIVLEINDICTRLEADKINLLSDNLYDLAYLLYLCGAYYVDRLRDVCSAEKALYFYARAEKILQPLYHEDPVEASTWYAQLLHNRGFLLAKMNNQVAANEDYEQAFRIRTFMHKVRSHVDTDIILSETAVNYAQTLLDAGNIKEALAKSILAVKLRKKYRKVQSLEKQELYMIALQMHGTVLQSIPNRSEEGFVELREVYKWAISHPACRNYDYFMDFAGNMLRQKGKIR